MINIRFVFAALAALSIVVLSTVQANSTDAAWLKLADGGYTILLRHALAPGTGDPANFTIGDCSTQRNLSARGRQQAQRIGARIAARGVVIDRVLSSEWCRTIQTAEFAFPRREIELFPPINSFFADRSTEPDQTAATIAEIRAFSGFGNQVMVTHQVNITALTGIVPRQGEGIIVTKDPDSDGIKVVTRLIFN